MWTSQRIDKKKIKKQEAYWVRELAQKVKMLSTKPDDFSSIPRTHIVERENHFPKVFL